MPPFVPGSGAKSSGLEADRLHRLGQGPSGPGARAAPAPGARHRASRKRGRSEPRCNDLPGAAASNESRECPRAAPPASPRAARAAAARRRAAFGMRHLRRQLELARRSAAAARRTRAARARRRAPGRASSSTPAPQRCASPSRGSFSSAPTVVIPMLLKNSLSKRVTSTGSASRASPSPRASHSAARAVWAVARRNRKPSSPSPGCQLLSSMIQNPQTGEGCPALRAAAPAAARARP